MTHELYSKVTSRAPGCLKGFVIEDSYGTKSTWVQGPEFLSKFLSCDCGNERLNIYASCNTRMNLAPIILECTKCVKKVEVFHPEKHGHDAQIGYNSSMIGTSVPKMINKIPARIVVEYSYQGHENYEELIEEGVPNPEDYFDFISFHICSEDGSLVEVISYECA